MNVSWIILSVVLPMADGGTDTSLWLPGSTPQGPAGMHRVLYGHASTPSGLSFAVSADFAHANDLLFEGDSTNESRQSIAVLWTLNRRVEVGVHAISNLFTDSIFPGTAAYNVLPGLGAKWNAGVWHNCAGALYFNWTLPASGTTHGTLSASDSIYRFSALGSRRISPWLELSVNAGYILDRGRLAAATFTNPAQGYAIGLDTTNRVSFGVGATSLLHPVWRQVAFAPYAELTSEWAVHTHFIDNPVRLTLGTKAYFDAAHTLEAELGMDVRLIGAPRTGSLYAGIPPWALFASFSWHSRLGALGLGENRVVYVPATPNVMTVIVGVVHDANAQVLGDARLVVNGNPNTTVSVDPNNGRYQTLPIVAVNGNITLEAVAPGYIGQRQWVPVMPKGGTATLNFNLQRKHTNAFLRLRVFDADRGWPLANARIFYPVRGSNVRHRQSWLGAPPYPPRTLRAPGVRARLCPASVRYRRARRNRAGHQRRHAQNTNNSTGESLMAHFLPQGRRRRGRDFLWMLLLLAMAGASGAGWWMLFKNKGATSQAKVIATVAGDANVQRGGRTLRLQPDSAIYPGDILVTQEHATDLGLSGGAVLRMGPLTHLEVNSQPPPMWRLRQGAVRIETTQQSTSLTVGMPYGTARTQPYNVSVLDIGVEDGIFVRVGEVSVERNDQVVQVEAGHKFTVDGLVLKIGPNDPTTLEEMVFHVQHPAEPNISAAVPSKLLPIFLLGDAAARLAHGGIAAKYPSKSRQPLIPGDTVLTGGGTSRVLLGKWGELALDSNTVLRVTAAVQQDTSATAQVILERGGMQYHLATGAHETRALSLRAGVHEAQIIPGYMRAQGRIARHDKQWVIKMRLGRLQTDARVVEAGSVVTLSGDGGKGSIDVRPLVAETADAHSQEQTVVHHVGEAPAIAFQWLPPAKTHMRLFEIARDAAFKNVLLAEKLHRGSFIVDTLVTGRKYYWRLDKNHADSLQVVPQVPASCPFCPGPNPVTDDLTHTVIQFEESMPDLDFTWSTIEGSESYLFRLYRNNHFDQPTFVAHTTSPNMIVPAGRLLPGGHIWRVTGYDDEGRLIHTSPSYELDMQDIDTRLLAVVAPPPNAVVGAESVTTRGSVRGGSALTCNGHHVSLGEDGAFAYSVALHPGKNLLVYTLRTGQHVRHVFTRVAQRAGVSQESPMRVSED